MEDPWANAWGEPSKTSSVDSPASIAASTGGPTSESWSAPSVSLIQGDHEDDLSTPAWSLKPKSGWGDPDIAETSLWGSDASAGWNPAPSTFDTISLASKDSTSEVDTHSPEATLPEPQEVVKSISISSSTSDEDVSHPSPPSQSPVQISSPIPSPFSLPSGDDLDGFGSFETTVEDTEDWGTPSKPSFSLPSADAVAWGAEPWEDPGSATQISETREELEDEWEVARQQKEKQDRHVPPELLAAILHQFEELPADIWPQAETQEEKEDERGRVVELDSLGLKSIMERLVPQDLVLPMNVPFSKTFISKQLSEALKLTRHSHVTRSSPVALYMASKGSTSWEASIKSKPNIIQEDIAPVGWKILDSTKVDSAVTADEEKRKPSGGLLSFFGRRGATPSAEPVGRSSSPIGSATSSVKPGASPRASMDSASGRRSTSHSVHGGKSTPASPSVATFGAVAALQSNSNALSEIPSSSTTISTDGIVREPSPPPPSAVSRFLGRFSSRSRAPTMDSIALSSDDLEFLSDVPSLTSPESDQSIGLDALSMMIKSSPLPTALPAPLAPPPKAPPKVPRVLPPPNRQSQNDDFLSFFDTPNSPQASNRSDSPLSLLTASGPTPPVKPVTSSLPSLIPKPLSNTPSIDQQSAETTHQTRAKEEDAWSSFDYPSVPVAKPLPPSIKRSFVPIMSSSSTSSSNAPPLLPKPGSPFTLPSPPSISRQASSNIDLLSGSSNIKPLLPPPQPSRPHTPLRQSTQLVSQQVNLDDEDDDFADFLSSPAQTTNSGILSFNDFTPTTSAAKPPPVRSQTLASSGYIFEDLLAPLPPQPPAKSNYTTTTAASTSSSGPSNPSPNPEEKPVTLVRKFSKKADHSRTLSLLETAAARGRWLNPPSPLPEALHPPPNGKHNGSSMQAQQAQAVSSLSASNPTPAVSSNGPEKPWDFPAPVKAVSLNPIPQSPLAAQVFSIPQPTPLPSYTQNSNGSTSSYGKNTGGLSAQDLSFFEGL